MKAGPLPRVRVAAIVAAALLALAAPAQAQVYPNIRVKPAAASRGPGDMHVFIPGTDKALWTTQWNGDAWSAWKSLSGEMNWTAGAGTHAGRLDAVITGGDDALYYKSSHAGDPVAWDAWRSVPRD